MRKSSFIRESITIEPNLDIGFVEVTPEMIRPYTPYHWHDSYEIIYVMSGSMTVQTLPVSKTTYVSGSVICTPPYQIHDITASKDTHFILAMIPSEVMRKYIPDLDQITFMIPKVVTSEIERTKLETLQKTMYQMLVAITFQEHGYLLRFQSSFFELMYQLYHNYSHYNKPATQIDKNYERLQQILSYVQDHYTSVITIDEISSYVNLQPQYFCHFFKKYMGQSFLSYVYEVRISKIEKDLLQTTDSIGTIAERHGFTNIDLFRKKFYKKNQCMPREYRRR
ncbi:helix-turn-helix domain-containing protein [Faecalicatena orotica]|uniref:AraC-like protein n=1 Tax=Faecalicatena orotica TaxID=1544 RepID=A0A2Y9BFP9_9FIRM|nr:AraC family transcriptional regulator [Faecalicatena orotica]PWJ28331.1 AraC-like protein [Faecalicatena orotica]SSA56786.1 AraC-like ligand binding domain-containing protein [Faecalicatena orotica]